MGVSGAVFESAGKRSVHWIPGGYSRTNTVPSGTGTISQNLVVIGKSLGGQPRTMIPFADANDAMEVLVGGELLDGVVHAFNGSNDFVPQHVFGFRVNNGLQSSITLKSGAVDMLKVYSHAYGAQANQLKIFIQDGTKAGTKKISVSFKGNNNFVDNIERKSFSVKYIGEKSNCTIKIEKNKAIITEENVIIAELSFEDYPTIDELVTRLNDMGMFLSQVIDGRSSAKTSDLDSTPEESVVETVTFKSDLSVFAETLLNVKYIGKVEIVATSIFKVPDNNTEWQYFSGGTVGSYSIEDWQESLKILGNEDVSFIVLPSTDKDVMTLIAKHCTDMNGVEARKERQALFGMNKGTSISAGIAFAEQLNSPFVSLCIEGANANNPLTGKAEDISPALVACKIAGIEAAMSINNPLTNKIVKVNSFDNKRTTAELNEMIKGGLMPFGINEGGELVCIRAMTTYQGDNLGLNERSCVREMCYMERDLRKAFSRRIGTAREPSEDEIKNVLKNKATEWYDLGVINSDANGMLVFGIKIKLDGDKTYLEYSRYIRTPTNFIFITSNNLIFTSGV